MYLLTDVGRGHSSVSRLVADLLLAGGGSVRATVHRDDGRADALRARGAEIVVGDLTRPADVAAAMTGTTRAFFNGGAHRAGPRADRAGRPGGGLAEQYSRALGRPVSGVDLSDDDFAGVLGATGVPPHVAQHILTVAKLHRAGRYDRFTDDVETITGFPAESVERYVAEHRDLFGQAAVPVS